MPVIGRWAHSIAVARGCSTIADGRQFVLSVNHRWEPGMLVPEGVSLVLPGVERLGIAGPATPRVCPHCGDPLQTQVVGHNGSWMFQVIWCPQHKAEAWLDQSPKFSGYSTEWEHENAWVVDEPEVDPTDGALLLMGGRVKVYNASTPGDRRRQLLADGSHDFWLTPKGLQWTARGRLRKLLKLMQ